MRGIMVAGVLVFCCGASAQPKPGMTPAFVPMSPAIAADQDAMKSMMAQMNAPYTGNADRDFVTHMIGHHQGAIDMAKIELKYGHDTEMRKMATGVIAAQQREIAEMQAWLGTRPSREFHPTNPHIQWK